MTCGFFPCMIVGITSPAIISLHAPMSILLASFLSIHCWLLWMFAAKYLIMCFIFSIIYLSSLMKCFFFLLWKEIRFFFYFFTASPKIRLFNHTVCILFFVWPIFYIWQKPRRIKFSSSEYRFLSGGERPYLYLNLLTPKLISIPLSNIRTFPWRFVNQASLVLLLTHLLVYLW